MLLFENYIYKYFQLFICRYSTHDASHVKQAKAIRSGGLSGVHGLENLFYKYHVDLYFSGHEHVYEHFGKTYRSKMNENGTSYIVRNF